jgi:DNA polymerase-3 subunit epsilon
LKVKAAIASLGMETPSYVILEKGRHFKEQAFILVKEGRYCGYGFVDMEDPISSIEDFEPFLKLQEATYHTHKILRGYLRKFGEEKAIHFKNEMIA